jgi:hypothetical protein
MSCIVLNLNVTGVEVAIENSNSEVLNSYCCDTVGCRLHTVTAVAIPVLHLFWKNEHAVDHIILTK